MSGDPDGSPEQEPAELPRPSRKWTMGLAALVIVFVALAGYDLLSGGVTAANRSSASRTSAQAAAGPTAGSSVQSAAPVVTSGPPATSSSTPSATSSPAARTAAASLLTIASAAAYGPDGPSDGDHPDLAAGVINGGDGKPWHSSWYDSPEFGNLQSGTGLLLEMGAAVNVSSVRLTLGSSAGADFEVWVEGMPLLTQRPSATASDVSGSVEVRLATPATGRFVLIWFTKLPPSGTGKFQVSVYSADVYGAKGTLSIAPAEVIDQT